MECGACPPGGRTRSPISTARREVHRRRHSHARVEECRPVPSRSQRDDRQDAGGTERSRRQDPANVVRSHPRKRVARSNFHRRRSSHLEAIPAAGWSATSQCILRERSDLAVAIPVDDASYFRVSTNAATSATSRSLSGAGNNFGMGAFGSLMKATASSRFFFADSPLSEGPTLPSPEAPWQALQY